MKRFFVLGAPIEHSQSPVMHNAAFARLGINAHYGRRLVGVTEIESVLDAFFSAGDVLGLNLTAPLKQEGARLCRERFQIDALADRIGAVNTLVRTEHGWTGYNTDAAGFVRSVKRESNKGDTGENTGFERALVIGGGGAARAVIAGLLQQQVELTIALRQGGQSWEMRNALKEFANGAEVIALEEFAEIVAQRVKNMLIVNATSADGDSEIALTKQVFQGLDALDGAQVVDLRYGRTSALLEHAKHLGAKVQDGRRMLLEQGVIAFELWSNAHLAGACAPREVMWSALKSVQP